MVVVFPPVWGPMKGGETAASYFLWRWLNTNGWNPQELISLVFANSFSKAGGVFSGSICWFLRGVDLRPKSTG